MFLGYKFSDQTERHNEFTKLLAFIFMVIGTIGNVFLPQMPMLGAMGAFALPVYSYLLYKGYKYTRNFKKYLFRLWVFALLAEIPFCIVYKTQSLNVLFGYIIALLIMNRFENKEYSWLPMALVGACFIHIQYFLLPVLMPITYYVLASKKNLSFIIQILFLIGYAFITKTPFMIFAVLGLWFSLYFPDDLIIIRINKYVFYWAYPLLFVLLFLVSFFA